MRKNTPKPVGGAHSKPRPRRTPNIHDSPGDNVRKSTPKKKGKK